MELKTSNHFTGSWQGIKEINPLTAFKTTHCQTGELLLLPCVTLQICSPYTREGDTLQQCFSDVHSPANSAGGLVNTDFCTSPSEILIQWVWGRVQEYAFLASFPGLLCSGARTLRSSSLRGRGQEGSLLNLGLIHHQSHICNQSPANSKRGCPHARPSDSMAQVHFIQQNQPPIASFIYIL